VPRERIAALPGISDVTGDGAVLNFQTDQPTATVAALMRVLEERHVELLDLHVRKASLEDVFLGLTRENEK
jgi:hypothetical protein